MDGGMRITAIGLRRNLDRWQRCDAHMREVLPMGLQRDFDMVTQRPKPTPAWLFLAGPHMQCLFSI